MRGHNNQSGVLHADEHHQHEIGRMIRAEKARLVDLPAVFARRFVTVMAIGNE